MSTPCRPCEAQNCVFPADLELYGLQGPNGPWTWLGLGPNEWRWVTVNCPPGYNCARGQRVRVRAGSLGKISTSGSSPMVKRLKCCDGTYVTGTFTRGMTQAQMNSVVARMFDAAAQKQAICNLNQDAIKLPPVRFRPKTLFLQDISTGDACLGIPFTSSIAVKFGPSNVRPFAFSQLSGALPPGLTVQTGSTGIYMIISGRPTVPGNYDFVIQAHDSPPGDQVDSKQYTIVVLGLTNAAPDPNGVIRLSGAPMCAQYYEQLHAAGGVGPYTYSIDPEMAPDWISIQSWGVLQGAPTQADVGTDFYFDVFVTDSTGRICPQHVVIAVTPLTCTTVPAFPNGALNTPYTYQLTAGFGTAPHTFGWNGGGALPPGITIFPGGLVAGTPTQVGDFSFGLNVFDKFNCLCQSGVTMKIVQMGNAGFSVACPGNPSIVAGTAANTYYSAGGAGDPDINNLNSRASVDAFNKLSGLGCSICNAHVTTTPRVNSTIPSPNVHGNIVTTTCPVITWCVGDHVGTPGTRGQVIFPTFPPFNDFWDLIHFGGSGDANGVYEFYDLQVGGQLLFTFYF